MGTATRSCVARAGALAVAIALSSASLYAQPSTPPAAPDSDSREQQRAALYREGVALADAGRWAEAVEKFRQVVAIRSAPPALFTLGQAEQRLGRLATAERTYERALADARATGNAQVADASVKAIASLTSNVPRVVVRIDPLGPKIDPNTIAATVDGAPIAIETPTKFDPGDHIVAVRAPGMSTFTTKALLLQGRTFEVLVAFVPAGKAPDLTVGSPAASTSASAPATNPGRPFPIGPTVVAGAAVTLGVVGYLVRASGKSDYDHASASCRGGLCPSQALVDDANSGRNQVLVGTVLLGAGIAALAGAGLWWALDSEPSKGAQVGLQLKPSPHEAGAWLVGRF